MLKKCYRLRDRRTFQQAMRGYRLCASPYFVVLGISRPRRPAKQPTRFGIVVSKRVHKRAVRRNRVRRQLREIIRQTVLVDDNLTVHAYDAIVIVVREAALNASYGELKSSLLRCFKTKPTRPHASSKDAGHNEATRNKSCPPD